jgi:hypothetical protein
MQKTGILVGIMTLVVVPCFAQAPSAGQVNLAAALGLSGEVSSCALPQGDIHFMAGGGSGSTSSVTCTATCGPYPSVSCTSTSGTCTAVDTNCATNKPGYVTCNGITTHCSSLCCPGSTKTVPAGCCDDGDTKRNLYQCVSGGTWQFVESNCGAPICSITP